MHMQFKIDRYSVQLSGKTAMISTKPRPPKKRQLKGQSNAKCWMRKNECTFHWTQKVQFENLTVAYEKLECRKQKLECCINRIECWMQKIESRVQTQMTNTKCRTDCAKYNVKWNIEFWRKWNAIGYNTG